MDEANEEQGVVAYYEVQAALQDDRADALQMLEALMEGGPEGETVAEFVNRLDHEHPDLGNARQIMDRLLAGG